MTQQEIIIKIQRDPLFALGFAIDNNPTGIINALAGAGFSGDGSRKYAYDVLLSLMKVGKKDEAIRIISSVAYLNDAPNYTGGYADYFIRTSPPNSKPKVPTVNGSKFSWTGLLAGLSAGLGVFLSSITQPDSSGTADLNPATCEKDTNYPDCCISDTACIEKKKKRKMWIIIGIAAGSLLLIIGLSYIIYKSKKTETETPTPAN